MAGSPARVCDPGRPYLSVDAVQRRGADWCTAVLGAPFTGQRHLTVVQDQLLKLADDAGIDPPLPNWIAQARAEPGRARAARDEQRRAQTERETAAWQAVLAQAAVELEVREGSRPRVRGTGAEPLRHAVPIRDVHSGTRVIRTHPGGRALCESERRAPPLALGETSDQAATCVRCLHWAPRVRATEDQPRRGAS